MKTKPLILSMDLIKRNEKEKIRVLPQSIIKYGELGDKGYMWEYFLYKQGWNELSEQDKIGEIEEFFSLTNHNAITVDVKWPALDHISRNVFVNELVEVDEYG